MGTGLGPWMPRDDQYEYLRDRYLVNEVMKVEQDPQELTNKPSLKGREGKLKQ